MSNPFVVGQPIAPQHFVGRKSEIEAAFDQIFNRSHLAIWGGPGMGKSSFLEKLASPEAWEARGEDPSNAVIILFSCETINPFTASAFWREVLSIMRDKLESEPDLQTDIETLLEQGQTTKDSLRQILRKLGKIGKYLVLLIDDYDAALRENEQYSRANMETFLNESRNLAYHCQERRYLSMIVTSLKRLNELGPPLNPAGSPWYNHYLFQSLKPFTDVEVQKLLSILSITPELQKAIREIAGGHPALLQMASSLLYRELRSTQWQEPDSQTFTRNFESDSRQILETIWDRCSEVEQTLLMLMALSGLQGRLPQARFDLKGINIIYNQKERELVNLEERGIIIRSPEKAGQRVPSFASLIIERWVIQELKNSDNASLEKRQKGFLNLMSHEQAKKVTDAIKWAWQHKDEVPSALEWFGRVSAALPSGMIQSLVSWM
ncbi:ATP-binding protein [Aetokthonos hydrillicola Thurmond2011]|jgi:predicted ATPase|uniref:ATP-binding protein n=1 Tax=Aetokthonos hydrillicola Thurmond2011 TaxID=2712845 RepID=A0AAP5I525_9CYAN|nr:ATP-binding protein [Aetokthonos hydrillicola]MBO3461785.1 ATP-binding protein [Aetokthonos hydrillicola CCALA 1050]MBW4590249.1 ATP-binding protein [Aetokthonos hydrillicola CCALA 1050]MDR9894820.1 ATP-binding protein [Aetokthonos hydrillicola Thurmond2011]